MVINDFATEEEAKAFVGYMKSQFFRFMMLLAKSDQNLTRHCYRFVPDIPVDKYGDVYGYFGKKEKPEIDFIKSLIKEWTNENTQGICLNKDS